MTGDSDTAGFCADGIPGPKRQEDDSNLKFENNYVSWSAQLARGLNASYEAKAISGIGLLDHPWIGEGATFFVPSVCQRLHSPLSPDAVSDFFLG